jgi:hypothetical protein
MIRFKRLFQNVRTLQKKIQRTFQIVLSPKPETRIDILSVQDFNVYAYNGDESRGWLLNDVSEIFLLLSSKTTH